VLFACVPDVSVGLSRPFVAAENEVNGSVTSCEGETRGVGSVDGIALA